MHSRTELQAKATRTAGFMKTSNLDGFQSKTFTLCATVIFVFPIVCIFIFIWVSLRGNYFDNGDFETFTISTRLMCSIVRGPGSKLEQQSGWEPVPRQHQLFARWSTPFRSAECLCRIRCTEFLQMGPAYSTNSRNCCFCSWCMISLLTFRISFPIAFSYIGF